eukprot:TRINITY_DN273_c1_g1_i1.p2 TRINITY_DN273_c1_g1~~TRINITY_DN273_c1_g1_i1.p2  ORF type:complete len:171 (+),score=84.69 TRINITY_DN273_c1_g1_i1:112-624(+)
MCGRDVSVAVAVAKVIEGLIEPEASGEGHALQQQQGVADGCYRYHALQHSDQSLYDMLDEWQATMHADDDLLIIALIYFDRVCVKSKLRVTSANVRGLLFACLVCAAKWQCEAPFRNTRYASMMDISPAALTSLELAVFGDTHFQFHVKAKHFATYDTDLSSLRHEMEEA